MTAFVDGPMLRRGVYLFVSRSDDWGVQYDTQLFEACASVGELRQEKGGNLDNVPPQHVHGFLVEKCSSWKVVTSTFFTPRNGLLTLFV